MVTGNLTSFGRRRLAEGDACPLLKKRKLLTFSNIPISNIQYPNISISQYPNIPISQYLNIPISQYPNIPISNIQYLNISISQYLTIPNNVLYICFKKLMKRKIFFSAFFIVPL